MLVVRDFGSGRRPSPLLDGQLGDRQEGAVTKLIVWGALFGALAGGVALFAFRDEGEKPRVAAASLAPPHGPPIDAAQIQSGRLKMEHMPSEVGKALETYSDEIVRNAEAIATRQARITGTCAPGSAIRIISEDGSVRCQQLPRGVVSVAAIAGVPRLSTTVTEAAGVAGGAGRYQRAGEDDFIVVPIALPDGAIVSSHSYTFFDDDASIDTAAFLYRSDDQPLATVRSSGAAPQLRVETTQRIDLSKVDTSRFAYFVYFQVSARAGAGIVPISASVGYRLP
jgi:hypothetical protein